MGPRRSWRGVSGGEFCLATWLIEEDVMGAAILGAAAAGAPRGSSEGWGAPARWPLSFVGAHLGANWSPAGRRRNCEKSMPIQRTDIFAISPCKNGELNEIHAPGASNASLLPLETRVGPMHRRGARRRGLHRKKAARFSESPADLSAAIRHRRLHLVWSPLDAPRGRALCKALLPRR